MGCIADKSAYPAPCSRLKMEWRKNGRTSERPRNEEGTSRKRAQAAITQYLHRSLTDEEKILLRRIRTRRRHSGPLLKESDCLVRDSLRRTCRT